jgi:tetratricopeptide (TPR) repeat protein
MDADFLKTLCIIKQKFMSKNKRLKTETGKGQEAIANKQEGKSLRNLLSIFIIIIISIAIYSNTLKNGFVYDDEFTIVNNTLIKNINNLPKLFSRTDYFAASGEMSYRPVVTLTYFIDYWLYGLKPLGYHLTNLLLHSINGVLLYIFLTLLVPRPSSLIPHLSLPLLISLLFITHPVLTEAVNAISFREDLLCFMFFISALILYIVHRSSLTVHCSKFKAFSLQLLSLSFYFLALLSKEMAIILPLIIFLYEWIYGGKKEHESHEYTNGTNMKVINNKFIRVIRPFVSFVFKFLLNPYIIGYIAVTCFYLYLRFFLFHNPVEEDITVWSLSERLLTLPYLILKYLLLLIAPVSLSADYVIAPVQSLISLKFIIPFIIVSVLVLVSVNSARALEHQSTSHHSFINTGAQDVVFGIFFFLLTLLPVYNIISIANPFAERYLYLPTVGFAIITGALVFWCSGAQKISKTRSIYILTVSILIISIYSFAVIQRNKIWADDYSLWSDTVIKVPESFKAHNGLGIVYDKQGRLDEAIKEYLTAIRFKPVYADAHNSLGNVYAKQGRIDEAIKEYKLALSIDPNYPEAHYNLGTAYGTSGLIDKAIEHFQIVLKLKPDFPEAHYNLGIAYHMKGLNDRAIEEYQIALRLKPGYTKAQDSLRKVLKAEK